MDPIGRKLLPHEPPVHIGTDHLFFITICAEDRASRPLLQPNVPELLLESARHRHDAGRWYIRVFLVMPDHVHALIRFPRDGNMTALINDWKRWTATKGNFTWQRGFFDHRLRRDESEREKADYILQNPVRAGLVKAPDQWPHRWIS